MLPVSGPIRRFVRWWSLASAVVALTAIVVPLAFGAASGQAARVPLQSGTYAYVNDHDPQHRLTATVRPTRTHAPWVVVLHGGSWVRGSQRNVANAAHLFARHGFQVFNVSYRLNGVTFADQQHDLRAAVTWIRAHAVRFGLDPRRGTAYGFSAGGHLAAELGNGGGFRVVVSVSGVLQPQRVADDAAGARPGSEPSTPIVRSVAAAEEHIVGCPYDSKASACRAQWRRFEPQTEIHRHGPATFIVQGLADPCVPPPTARAYAYWLARAGIPHQLVTVPGVGHTDQVLFGSRSREEQMLQFVAEHSR